MCSYILARQYFRLFLFAVCVSIYDCVVCAKSDLFEANANIPFPDQRQLETSDHFISSSFISSSSYWKEAAEKWVQKTEDGQNRADSIIETAKAIQNSLLAEWGGYEDVLSSTFFPAGSKELMKRRMKRAMLYSVNHENKNEEDDRHIPDAAFTGGTQKRTKKNQLTFMFAGTSITATHDNYYLHGYPHVMARTMAPAFQEAGIDIAVYNHAMGDSKQYRMLFCTGTMHNSPEIDIDVLGIEYSIGLFYPGIDQVAELFQRFAANWEHYPTSVLYLDSSTGAMKSGPESRKSACNCSLVHDDVEQLMPAWLEKLPTPDQEYIRRRLGLNLNSNSKSNSGGYGGVGSNVSGGIDGIGGIGGGERKKRGGNVVVRSTGGRKLRGLGYGGAKNIYSAPWDTPATNLGGKKGEEEEEQREEGPSFDPNPNQDRSHLDKDHSLSFRRSHSHDRNHRYLKSRSDFIGLAEYYQNFGMHTQLLRETCQRHEDDPLFWDTNLIWCCHLKGGAAWHPGPVGHRLRGVILAYGYLSLLVEAVIEIQEGASANDRAAIGLHTSESTVPVSSLTVDESPTLLLSPARELGLPTSLPPGGRLCGSTKYCGPGRIVPPRCYTTFEPHLRREDILNYTLPAPGASRGGDTGGVSLGTSIARATLYKNWSREDHIGHWRHQIHEGSGPKARSNTPTMGYIDWKMVLGGYKDSGPLSLRLPTGPNHDFISICTYPGPWGKPGKEQQMPLLGYLDVEIDNRVMVMPYLNHLDHLDQTPDSPNSNNNNNNANDKRRKKQLASLKMDPLSGYVVDPKGKPVFDHKRDYADAYGGGNRGGQRDSQRESQRGGGKGEGMRAVRNDRLLEADNKNCLLGVLPPYSSRRPMAAAPTTGAGAAAGEERTVDVTMRARSNDKHIYISHIYLM